jgi:hypothetical protein
MACGTSRTRKGGKTEMTWVVAGPLGLAERMSVHF